MLTKNNLFKVHTRKVVEGINNVEIHQNVENIQAVENVEDIEFTIPSADNSLLPQLLLLITSSITPCVDNSLLVDNSFYNSCC